MKIKKYLIYIVVSLFLLIIYSCDTKQSGSPNPTYGIFLSGYGPHYTYKDPIRCDIQTGLANPYNHYNIRLKHHETEAEISQTNLEIGYGDTYHLNIAFNTLHFPHFDGQIEKRNFVEKGIQNYGLQKDQTNL